MPFLASLAAAQSIKPISMENMLRTRAVIASPRLGQGINAPTMIGKRRNRAIIPCSSWIFSYSTSVILYDCPIDFALYQVNTTDKHVIKISPSAMPVRIHTFFMLSD